MNITVEKAHPRLRDLAVLAGMLAPVVSLWALIAMRRRRVAENRSGYGEWWDALGV
jgi:hypothetical protein